MYKKNKILILGGSGMVGSTLFWYLKNFSTYQVVGTSQKVSPYFEYFSVDDFFEDENVITSWKADIIVNCIVSKSRTPSLMNKVNGMFVVKLAKICQVRGIRLIQISTDGVFSGDAGPYDKTRLPEAIDDYGKSKILGENLDSGATIIRCSPVGRSVFRKEGLWEWFFSSGTEVNGYTNYIWTGCTTVQLAERIRDIIEGDNERLVHYCPNELISKYEFLKILDKEYKLNKNINPMTLKLGLNRSLCSKETRQKKWQTALRRYHETEVDFLNYFGIRER